MRNFLQNGNMDISNSDILTQMLHFFTDEILKDFQIFVSQYVKLPSSLWRYNDLGTLEVIRPSLNDKLLPSFCIKLRNELPKHISDHFCSEMDKVLIAEYLSNYDVNSLIEWSILKCSFNIDRLIFPLSIENKLIGALVVGKFRTINDSIYFEKMSKTIDSNLLSLQKKGMYTLEDIVKYNALKTNLKSFINDIPLFSEFIINETANDILKLMPLLKQYYIQSKTKKALFDGLIFLESINYSVSELYPTYPGFLKSVHDMLTRIARKFNLHSAIVFFSSPEDVKDLISQASDPEGLYDDHLYMASDYDLKWIIDQNNQNKAVILPIKYGPLVWLNDFVGKIFRTKDAIIYAKKVLSGQVVLVGFGFTANIFLNQLEKVLLKESVHRLYKFINNGLTSFEVDRMMGDMGHMLRRTAGEIKSGILSLDRYDNESGTKKGIDIDDLKKEASLIIHQGVFKLDLISRTFYAFNTLKDLQLSRLKPADMVLEEVDIIASIHNINDKYSFQLCSNGLRIEEEFNVHKCVVKASKDIIELLLFNLIDNAIKYSYNNKYIHIKIDRDGNYYTIYITNLGIGVPEDEYDAVFQRGYKSRWKNPYRRSDGTGIGLALCKKIMDLYFPEPNGLISLKSIQASIKFGKSRFDGDNYLTTIKLVLPIY
jgi:signal transduction histidine kinase